MQWIFCALFSLSLVLADRAGAVTFRLLHINDFQSRVEPITAQATPCHAEEALAGGCYGGYARLATAIDEARSAAAAAGLPSLLVSTGDHFQGSLFFSAYKGGAEKEFLNWLGFDVLALGNHEYDLGPKATEDFVRALNFPVLFGNADISRLPGLAKLRKEPVLVEIDGETVALLGAITPDTAIISRPGKEINFEDPKLYLQREIEALAQQGVSRIVLLSHLGLETDLEIAKDLPGLDLIVSGDTKRLFSNADPDANYPYPIWVSHPGGTRTGIVGTGGLSRYLGIATVSFDDDGNLQDVTGDARLLDATVAQDAEIKSRIKELSRPIDELKARKIAFSRDGVDGTRDICRAGECELGNLVADAMLENSRRQGVSIALTNAGGLRAGITPGQITMADILTALPFQNATSTFNLTGAEIIEALENGVSTWETGGGRFPQVAGLKFTWDPTAAPLEARITSVSVRENETWLPIDPERSYAIVTNNFLRDGGDGYIVFRDKARNAYDFGPLLEDVVAEYLAKLETYTARLDGRISRDPQ